MIQVQLEEKKNPVTSLSMSIPNIKADFAISINEILIYFN